MIISDLISFLCYKNFSAVQFPILNSVEHLLMCLLVIYVSSLKKCFFSSLPFKYIFAAIVFFVYSRY